MDRICINKLTGELIEFQSGGDDLPDLMESRLNALLQNAINSGHTEENIEVKWVTTEEREALRAPLTSQIEEQRKEEVRRQLQELDIRSIRGMREMLAGIENPPAFIVAHEEQAQALREQL